MTKVIRGENLIRNSRYLDFVDGFVDLIDPRGWNIIEFESLHNDSEIRLQMLFKLKEQEDPFEGQLTVPFVIYKTMYEVIGEDGKHVN